MAHDHPPAAIFGADSWAVRLTPGQSPERVAMRVGAIEFRRIEPLADTYLFLLPGSAQRSADVDHVLAAVPDILWHERQMPQERTTRATVPSDPQFPNQWHLRGAPTHVDANLVPAWKAGITGQGVVVGVVDTGVDIDHPDLVPNYRAALSYDYYSNDSNPDDGHGHGTSAAGVAAAANDEISCGVGAAYRAGIAGLRLLDSGGATDAQEASSLGHLIQDVHISNNSWGPSDNGRTLAGPGPLTRQVLEESVLTGRGGLGTIYVWAGGNGGSNQDDAGADGYASARQTISVAAVTNTGARPWYGERGAAHLVAAPSDGGSLGITTTARGGGCTSGFGGTSSASPLAAGVVALVLQANPELGWRDVQHILMRTTVKNDPSHASWFDNGAGYHFNEFYGFGMVDAAAAVALAQTWENVGPALEYESPQRTPNVVIPTMAAGQGVADSIEVDTAITALEHAEVVFDATHTWRGDIEVTLISPAGSEIRLIQSRSNDSSDNFSGWKFTASAFWGENPNGTWTLRVRDAHAEDNGTWTGWRLTLYGTVTPEPAIFSDGFEPSDGM